MSNSFPKVSHDGKWIVWVKSKNGQLMRPDSRLWIVPFEGGEAREMRCNTNKMNSWHSFSPNSRWMVFSSKVNRPYTQMFLTHIDADGKDTPPILIPNSTADNRAVNLPEFLNGSQDVLRTIHVPAVDHHAPYQLGLNLAEDGKYLKATEQFKLALKEDPTFTRAYVGLGQAYVRLGRLEEALQTCEKGLQANPWSPELLNLIATVLYDSNRREEAIRYFEKGLELDQTGSVLANLLRAVLQMDDLERKLHYLTYAIDTEPRILNHRRVIARVLVEHRRSAEAIPHLNTLLHVDDKDWESKISLAWALATTRDSKIRDGARAVGIAREAVAETRNQEPAALAALAAAMAEAGQVSEALELAQKAQRMPSRTQSRLVMDLPLQIQAYRAGKPYRE
jgi:tetratricopeptide (TPR) repeat protein